MMTPIEAIFAEPPQVWLTSLYGFDPNTWGFLGFSSMGDRDRFVGKTKAGVLIVVYGQKAKSPPNMRGKVIGLQQVSHRTGTAKDFMDPKEWMGKEEDPESAGKWDAALKVTRAWKVAEKSYLSIEEFADQSYSVDASRTIGSRGRPLTATEARKILELTLIETSVYGEEPVANITEGFGRDVLNAVKSGRDF